MNDPAVRKKLFFRPNPPRFFRRHAPLARHTPTVVQAVVAWLDLGDQASLSFVRDKVVTYRLENAKLASSSSPTMLLGSVAWNLRPTDVRAHLALVQAVNIMRLTHGDPA